MTLRLYIDENAMDKALLQALCARGANVLTAQGRALYSFNVGDFCRLHTFCLAQGKVHAGIILAQQQRYTVGAQMRRLLRLIAAKSAEDMQNQVEFLSAWDCRQSCLTSPFALTA